MYRYVLHRDLCTGRDQPRPLPFPTMARFTCVDVEPQRNPLSHGLRGLLSAETSLLVLLPLRLQIENETLEGGRIKHSSIVNRESD